MKNYTLFFLSLSMSYALSESLGEKAQRFAKALLLPQDIYTEKYIVQWKKWNPVPKATAHKDFAQEIARIDSSSYGSSGDYMKKKQALFFKTNADRVRISPKEFTLFKYGPLCALGRNCAYYYHTMPTALILCLAKYGLLYEIGKDMKDILFTIKPSYKPRFQK